MRDDKERLEIVNVRLPDELLRILDELVKKGLFANRSEAIREFARAHIASQRTVQATRENGGNAIHG